MFLKVMWNREDMPEFSLIQCGKINVARKKDGADRSYVHVSTDDPEYSVCLKPGRSFAYVMNDDGKTIDTIRA